MTGSSQKGQCRFCIGRAEPGMASGFVRQAFAGRAAGRSAALSGLVQAEDSGSAVLRKRQTPIVTPLTAVAAPLTKTRSVLVSPVIMN